VDTRADRGLRHLCVAEEECRSGRRAVSAEVAHRFDLHSPAFGLLADRPLVVSMAIGGPVLGGLVDRGRQTPVLLASAAVAAALLGVIAVVPATTPLALLLALSAAIGVPTPPVGPCLRSQLPALLPDQDQLQAVYALETSLNELSWICGPPLVLCVGALWSTGGALTLAGLVLLAGTVGFATQPASRAWRPDLTTERRRGGSLRTPAMRTLMIVLLCLGVLVGADEVAVTVSAKMLEGSTAAAAPLFALWGAGSFAGGLRCRAEGDRDRGFRVACHSDGRRRRTRSCRCRGAREPPWAHRGICACRRGGHARGADGDSARTHVPTPDRARRRLVAPTGISRRSVCATRPV
jgi:hypothetical protein